MTFCCHLTVSSHIILYVGLLHTPLSHEHTHSWMNKGTSYLISSYLSIGISTHTLQGGEIWLVKCHTVHLCECKVLRVKIIGIIQTMVSQTVPLVLRFSYLMATQLYFILFYTEEKCEFNMLVKVTVSQSFYSWDFNWHGLGTLVMCTNKD